MKPDSQSKCFLQTVLMRAHNSEGVIQNIRALIDPGAQVSLIAEEAISKLKLQKRYAQIPVRVTGVNSEVDYISNEFVDLALTNFNESHKTVTATLLVIPNCTWPYNPPDSVPNWIRNLKLNLADPDILDPFKFPLQFQMILNVSYSVQVVYPIPLYRLEKFEVRNTLFGYVLLGETPSITSSKPPEFFRQRDLPSVDHGNSDSNGQ